MAVSLKAQYRDALIDQSPTLIGQPCLLTLSISETTTSFSEPPKCPKV